MWVNPANRPQGVARAFCRLCRPRHRPGRRGHMGPHQRPVPVRSTNRRPSSRPSSTGWRGCGRCCWQRKPNSPSPHRQNNHDDDHRQRRYPHKHIKRSDRHYSWCVLARINQTSASSAFPASLSSSAAAILPAAPTALGTLYALLKRRHLNVIGIARHVDQGLVSAGIVQAIGDQVLHPQLAHVAERHRRPGSWLQLGRHQAALGQCPRLS
jgi:hypothetical protein